MVSIEFGGVSIVKSCGNNIACDASSPESWLVDRVTVCGIRIMEGSTNF